MLEAQRTAQREKKEEEVKKQAELAKAQAMSKARREQLEAASEARRQYHKQLEREKEAKEGQLMADEDEYSRQVEKDAALAQHLQEAAAARGSEHVQDLKEYSSLEKETEEVKAATAERAKERDETHNMALAVREAAAMEGVALPGDGSGYGLHAKEVDDIINGIHRLCEDVDIARARHRAGIRRWRALDTRVRTLRMELHRRKARIAMLSDAIRIAKDDAVARDKYSSGEGSRGVPNLLAKAAREELKDMERVRAEQVDLVQVTSCHVAPPVVYP